MQNALYELFPTDNIKEVQETSGGKILIFDFHNLAYRNVFTAIHYEPEDNYDFFFWKHLMLNSIITSAKKFKPKQIFLAVDSRGSWRYDHYKDYKNKRKTARDKAAVDFERFHPIMNDFVISLKETFSNMYVLDSPRTEADDIIAVLIKDILPANKEKIIISSDKDMNQLLTIDNVRQYEPIKQKFVGCLNPKRELDIKIIMGDKSDCIPAIKPKCGIATAEKILKAGLVDLLESDTQIKENWERNRILIDMNFIPDDIKNGIINTYDDYEIAEINGSKLMSFFTKNRMMKHMEQWQQNSEYIKVLR